MAAEYLIMKICPQCRSTYTDDTLQFCLQDGTPLAVHSDYSSSLPTVSWAESETLLHNKPEQVRIDLQESKTTQSQNVENPYITNAEIEPPKKSKTFLLVLLGLLLLLVVGVAGVAGVFYYLGLNNNNVVQNTNNNLNNNSNPFSNLNTNSNSNSNSNSDVNTNTNVNVATPTPKPTLKPAEIEAAKKEVESTIYGWKSSAENHNLEANLSNYADTVDYYKAGKLNRSKLKTNKEPAYKRYDSIEIDIENIKVTPDAVGEKATVIFDKFWDFTGVDKDGNDIFYRGKVQQQLILNKVGGKWRIVSEKDLKVYNSDRSSSADGGY